MPKAPIYFVYILTSGIGGTLYVGVTNNLIRRVQAHRDGSGSQFTKRYNVRRLIYYEVFNSVEAAIAREKQLKRWRRDWKVRLIEEHNRDWRDLFYGLMPKNTQFEA